MAFNTKIIIISNDCIKDALTTEYARAAGIEPDAAQEIVCSVEPKINGNHVWELVTEYGVAYRLATSINNQSFGNDDVKAFIG